MGLIVLAIHEYIVRESKIPASNFVEIQGRKHLELLDINIFKTNTNGILLKESKTTVKITMDYFEEFLKTHGVKIYARINQKNEAENAGLTLPDIEYLLFGNPTKGSELMMLDPLIALDLPLKLIAWSDKDGKTRIAFNEGSFIAGRYGINADGDSPLNLESMISYVLKNIIP